MSSEPPSYHDLHITTATIERRSIFDLPHGLEVMCSRTSGWTLWNTWGKSPDNWVKIAGEYEEPEKWLILDVDGHVIVNSRDRVAEPA